MSAAAKPKAVLLVDGGYFENVSDIAEAEHDREADLEKLSEKLAD